jgi:hypothetical protein
VGGGDRGVGIGPSGDAGASREPTRVGGGGVVRDDAKLREVEPVSGDGDSDTGLDDGVAEAIADGEGGREDSQKNGARCRPAVCPDHQARRSMAAEFQLLILQFVGEWS